MTKLNCSASTCMHNTQNYCCKNQIKVGGENATASTSTCCESFQENNGAFTNSTQNPNITLSVSCDASNCVHNNNSICEANSIDVSGSSASTAKETQCSSFTCK